MSWAIWDGCRGQADMTWTSSDLCPPKIVGSQAQYPTQSKNGIIYSYGGK